MRNDSALIAIWFLFWWHYRKIPVVQMHISKARDTVLHCIIIDSIANGMETDFAQH